MKGSSPKYQKKLFHPFPNPGTQEQIRMRACYCSSKTTARRRKAPWFLTFIPCESLEGSESWRL